MLQHNKKRNDFVENGFARSVSRTKKSDKFTYLFYFHYYYYRHYYCHNFVSCLILPCFGAYILLFSKGSNQSIDFSVTIDKEASGLGLEIVGGSDTYLVS